MPKDSEFSKAVDENADLLQAENGVITLNA